MVPVTCPRVRMADRSRRQSIAQAMLLGQLVGTQRPTVSTALGELIGPTPLQAAH